MKRVTGIGGIFFKAEDPKALNAWYQKHLGFETTEWGTTFSWKETGGAEGQTVWNAMKATSNYFDPSQKPFMINYRVADLASLMPELEAEGVTIAGPLQDSPYGKFAWIMDPEGNKIELWEPPKE